MFIRRAGLTTVPFMPWHSPPPLSGGPRGHLLNCSCHVTFYKYGSIRVWRRIWLFYQIAPVLKSTGHFFYKRGAPNPGPQDRVPETRAPAKLYVTLWLQFVVWRHFCWQHQCLRAMTHTAINCGSNKLRQYYGTTFLRHNIARLS